MHESNNLIPCETQKKYSKNIQINRSLANRSTISNRFSRFNIKIAKRMYPHVNEVNRIRSIKQIVYLT